MLHDVICTQYSFSRSTPSRRAHWGVDFHLRESQQHWGGTILLSYKSDEEALHRGGRMANFDPALRLNGVKRTIAMGEGEATINSLQGLEGRWGLVVPDQVICMDNYTLDTVWYFSDEDEGFLFALGINQPCERG